MTVEQHARSQALYRAVNERMFGASRGLDPLGSFVAVCECGTRECNYERVSLTRAEYELIRSDPTHFVVVAAHLVEGEARVVARGDGYVVIAAAAIAGDIARATYRRSGPLFAAAAL